MQAFFVEPGVELYSQRSQVPAYFCDHALYALRSQSTHGLSAGQVEIPVAVLPGHLLPYLHDIVPVVAVLWKWLIPAQRLGIASINARAELAHLGAGVVDVILPLDLVARRRQHVSQGVADDRVAGRGDSDRPGGIGADKFDLPPPSLANVHIAPTLPCGQDHLHLRHHPGRIQRKVDVPWPSHLDLAHERGRWDMFNYPSSNLAGGHPRLPRQAQADRRSVIAVAGLARAIHDDRRHLKRRQCAFLLRTLQSRDNQHCNPITNKFRMHCFIVHWSFLTLYGTTLLIACARLAAGMKPRRLPR